MLKPWPCVSSHTSADFRIFRVRTDTKKSPQSGATYEFFVIDTSNWVNVIATTPNQELVMVEQYRHGSNSVELEVPGGVIDPDDPSPLEGGLRELLEETGYQGQNGQIIAEFFPNPAILNNRCYVVYVDQCHSIGLPHWDATEEIQIRLIPLKEIPGLIACGSIKHSLVISSWYHFHLWKSSQ